MSKNRQKDHKASTSDPEMKIRDHQRWTKGDFALISADGVRFRIDSTLLCWASTVLKDAIELGLTGKKELHLTDTEIESSTVLHNFLTLVTHGGLGWPTSGTYTMAEIFYNLISFLRKYDAERPLNSLREKIVNQLLLGKVPPFYVLMSAVAMDDVELSILAFQFSFSATTVEGEKPFISDALLSLSPSSALEDGTWPSQVLHRFPLDFLWACTKAWTAKWGSERTKAALETYRGYNRDSDQYKVDIASEYEKAIRTVRPLPKPKK